MKTTIRILATLACAGLAAFRHTTIAAPGDLDLTFGGTGKVTTVIGSSFSSANSVAVQADGKIVISGSSYNGIKYDSTLVRYNANGSLDMSFNGTGNVTTDFGSDTSNGSGVALQSDGKIVVAGHSQIVNNQDFAVARYNANGSLDMSFNGTGKVTTAIGSGNDTGRAVAIQSDGKIVVAGESKVGNASDFALVRYNVDGSLDTTFNGTGKVTTAIGTSEDRGYSVAIQSDGKIVVAGDTYNGTNYDFALVRYNADGSRDPSFNGNGKVSTDFGGSNDSGYGVAVQSDGKIVIAGSSGTGSNTKFAVARYNVNGGLDTTFNGTGKVTTTIDINGDSGSSVAVQSDGKIVVAGTSGISYPYYDFALVRYNPNGSLDTTFNGIGKVTATFFGSNRSQALSVAIQGDGNIVAAGGAYGTLDFIALARFQGSPLAPEITVEQPAGTDLVDATANVVFGGVLVGSSASRIFTIKNTGGSNLTGLGITFDGANAGILPSPPTRSLPCLRVAVPRSPSASPLQPPARRPRRYTSLATTATRTPLTSTLLARASHRMRMTTGMV